MKKIILPGIVAGIAMFVIGLVFTFLINAIIPSLALEYSNTQIFRPWTDPAMSIFFLYPFVLGVVLSWVWDKTKKLLKGTKTEKAIYFGLSVWLISTVPGMLITYSSFQVSATLIFIWALSGLIDGVISGLVFSRMST